MILVMHGGKEPTLEMKKKSLYINIFFQKTPNFWKATRVSAASYIERKGINKGRSSQKKSDREKKEVRKKKKKKNKKKSCNVIRRYTQWMERKKKEALGEKEIFFYPSSLLSSYLLERTSYTCARE